MKQKIRQMSVPDTGKIKDVMQAIGMGGLGAALLVDREQRLLGVVTDGDVRRALLSGLQLESPAMDIKRPETLTATQDMSTEEITRLFSKVIRVLPILDDKGRVADLAVFDSRYYLPVAEPFFGGEELMNLSECVLTGWVSSSGKYVTQFEQLFAEYVGSKYAVSTTNGTTALHLALLAAGVGRGDEVIVPSLTFIATANAVMHAGGKPVFVDSEERTWNIDAKEIEKAITKKTKAIIPVHLYGHPAAMDAIMRLARKHGLVVIEDAAEAHGAMYRGRKVGSIGDLGIFSFYGNKIITTGEGGMIVTDDESLAEKARILRDHGMDSRRRYWHTVLGYNCRMTNMQAALGVAQMKIIDKVVAKKRENAMAYNEALKGVRGIKTPPEAKWAKNVYWLYSILVDEAKFGMSAPALRDFLRQNNVETRALFIPAHKQPIYNQKKELPVAERLSATGISLPSSANLKRNDIQKIVSCIKKARG